MSGSKENGTKYRLGIDGKYGYAYLSYGTVKNAKSVHLTGDDAKAHLPQTYAPYVRLHKDRSHEVEFEYKLHIMCCAPQEQSLDKDNPVRFDYKGSSAFVFLNWEKSSNDGHVHDEYKYYAINCIFKPGISARLANKTIFVIPVHDDPEEGEITKVVVEPEDEI